MTLSKVREALKPFADLADECDRVSLAIKADLRSYPAMRDDFCRAREALALLSAPERDDGELVKRLHYHHEDHTGKTVLINPDGPEAADRIEALSAQVRELERAYSDRELELLRKLEAAAVAKYDAESALSEARKVPALETAAEELDEIGGEVAFWLRCNDNATLQANHIAKEYLAPLLRDIATLIQHINSSPSAKADFPSDGGRNAGPTQG